MTVKKRSQLDAFFSGKQITRNNGVPAFTANVNRSSIGFETLVTESNQWPPRSPAAKRRNIGSAFTVSKNWSEFDAIPVSAQSNPSNIGLNYTYEGTMVPYNGNLTAGGTHLSPSPLAERIALGSTGIARTRPTKPQVEMGQFFAEARDLKSLDEIGGWQQRADKLRNLARRVGNTHITVQFALLPFVRDLVDFANTVLDIEKIIKQLDRDSGKVVRRRTTLIKEGSSNVAVIIPNGSATGDPSLPLPMYQTRGVLLRTTTVTRSVWFSGAYIYHLPKPGGGFRYETQRAALLLRYLFGASMTPDLIWNLAPWSWAIDWRTNIGDVISNFSSFTGDNLVLKYGYLMEEKTSAVVYTLKGTTLKNFGSIDGVQVHTQRVRSRIHGTPYGFGLNPSSFTAKQWSIIGALGISRLPRAL